MVAVPQVAPESHSAQPRKVRHHLGPRQAFVRTEAIAEARAFRKLKRAAAVHLSHTEDAVDGPGTLTVNAILLILALDLMTFAQNSSRLRIFWLNAHLRAIGHDVCIYGQ